jgi:hypothetical protein
MSVSLSRSQALHSTPTTNLNHTMAGTRSSKKRRKANASSSSSVSSSPAQPSRNQRNKKIISLVNDSEDEPTPTTIDNPADSTQPAKLQEMTDEQELCQYLLCPPII